MKTFQAEQINQLALSIAQVFQDNQNLPKYLVYCKKYPDTVIKQAFEESLQIPENRLKKPRPSTFFYLAKHYAHQSL